MDGVTWVMPSTNPYSLMLCKLPFGRLSPGSLPLDEPGSKTPDLGQPFPFERVFVSPFSRQCNLA
jgi:hypothetical protein